MTMTLRSRALAALLALASPAAIACTVSTTPVAFGSIDPIASAPTDSTGTVIVSCPEQTTYSVAIDGGNGTVDRRHLASGVDRLNYQLYTDASLALVWGDGTAGTVTANGTAGPAGDTTHTIYGRVPAQPLAKVGPYSDSLVVTVIIF